jgi:hypothetical protein
MGGQSRIEYRPLAHVAKPNTAAVTWTFANFIEAQRCCQKDPQVEIDGTKTLPQNSPLHVGRKAFVAVGLVEFLSHGRRLDR